jgi:hypothetical protein
LRKALLLVDERWLRATLEVACCCCSSSLLNLELLVVLSLLWVGKVPLSVENLLLPAMRPKAASEC